MFRAILAILLLATTFVHKGSAQPADPPMGVTSTADGLRIRVWAPNAESVEVIGDFNNWKAMGTAKLSREGNTGIWSTTLKRSIPKGSYRFLINGNLQRRDPYARETTPDGAASVFYKTDAFDWSGDKTPEYSLDDLVIYEMHPGAFYAPDARAGKLGTFADAIKRLDYLKELGVNVVQLMPVHEFWGSRSWGYNPSDVFSVEQAYGGADGLKQFVKEAHRRGLAVHLDIVHNHYDPNNAALLQFDGTGEGNEGGIYFYDKPGLAQTPWGPRPRFDEKMVRRYIRDNAMMWLEEYHLDGFRWDSTVNIRAYNDGRNPIPAGAKMLEDINTEIKKRFPKVFSIAEDSLGIGNFHASWDYGFHNTVMPQFARADNERDLRVIERAMTAKPPMQRVIYLDNHDEAGKLNGQTRFANDVDPTNPGSVKARRLSGLGALLTLTAPGTPLLFMGNEFLESGAFHEDRILDWSKRQKFDGLVSLNRDLIHLRRNLDGAGNALKGGGINFQTADGTKNLLVYWRWNEKSADERMVIAMNLSEQTLTDISVLFPADGPWVTKINTEWIRYGGDTREDNQPVSFRGGTRRLSVTLPPYSAQIFALKNIRSTTLPAATETLPAEVRAPPPPAPVVVENVNFDSITLMRWTVDNEPHSWPLKKVGPILWDGYARFDNVSNGGLWLSANADGKTYWGQAYDSLNRLPYQTKMDRPGSDIQIQTKLDGIYRVRFNAQTRAFRIEAASTDATETMPADTPEQIRTWTDTRGRTVEAKLISVKEASVLLENASGAILEVPLNALSPDDQAYAKERRAP